MSNDPYVIISADCHAGLPTEEYRDYLDPQFREAFDQFLVQRNELATKGLIAAGHENDDFITSWFEDNEEGLRGGWDATIRDKELDGDGVAAEVIFPDSDAVLGGASAPFGAGLGLSGDGDPTLLMAGAKAHNRWLAELCAGSPVRRVGLAIVPILDDVDAAVVEIRSAHKAGLRGVLMPSMWVNYPPYHDRRYDPVWAVCEELDMPIHTHTGAVPRHEYGQFFGIATMEAPFWAYRPLGFMLWSGVFERFPKLKYVVTEAGCFWLDDLIWRWDTVYNKEYGAAKLAGIAQHITKLPSEYVDANFWTGASNTKVRELARRYEIGVGNIMWGNDFPHPEGTWPHTKTWLRETFHDIPIDESRKMLGLNAAEVYNFDLDALAARAAEIGPTPADLGQDHGDFSKWDDLRAVERPWLTGKSAVPATGM